MTESGFLFPQRIASFLKKEDRHSHLSRHTSAATTTTTMMMMSRLFALLTLFVSAAAFAPATPVGTSKLGVQGRRIGPNANGGRVHLLPSVVLFLCALSLVF